MDPKNRQALVISSYDNHPETKMKVLAFFQQARILRDIEILFVDRNTRQLRKYCRKVDLPVVRTDFNGDFLGSHNPDRLAIINICDVDRCSMRIRPYLESRSYEVTMRYLSREGPINISYW